MTENNQNPLSILSTAISDVGLWTWYSAELPEFLQLEFNWTQLYQAPIDPESPPNSHIALQFQGLKAVVILEDTDPERPENWLEKMTNDQLEPDHLNDDQFSFQPEEIIKMMHSAGKTQTVYGTFDPDKIDESKDLILGFRAGSRGMVVQASHMGLACQTGAINFESLGELHEQWWAYWDRYWSVRDDKTKALPFDPVCEVVIPATESEFEAGAGEV